MEIVGNLASSSKCIRGAGIMNQYCQMLVPEHRIQTSSRASKIVLQSS